VAGGMPDLWLPSQPCSSATAPWLVLTSDPADGRRLSWPTWLLTYVVRQYATEWPFMSVLTEMSVE